MWKDEYTKWLNYKDLDAFVRSDLEGKSDKDLEDITTRIFSNQEETKRLSDQLMSKKLLDFYKKYENFLLSNKSIS